VRASSRPCEANCRRCRPNILPESRAAASSAGAGALHGCSPSPRRARSSAGTHRVAVEQRRQVARIVVGWQWAMIVVPSMPRRSRRGMRALARPISGGGHLLRCGPRPLAAVLFGQFRVGEPPSASLPAGRGGPAGMISSSVRAPWGRSGRGLLLCALKPARTWRETCLGWVCRRDSRGLPPLADWPVKPRDTER